MSAKNKIAKALAPVAKTSAEKSTDYWCLFIYNQPKMPKKLMHKVK